MHVLTVWALCNKTQKHSVPVNTALLFELFCMKAHNCSRGISVLMRELPNFSNGRAAPSRGGDGPGTGEEINMYSTQ